MSEKLKNALYELIPLEKKELFDKISSERTRYLTVLLEDIYQEHNASAILRNCDCFGIQELHVIEQTNKYKVQRDIARGAGKWVDIIRHKESETPQLDALKQLKEKGYKIAALTPDAAEFDIYSLPIDQPLALSFGTEWKGISDEMREIADYKVKIPMVGFTESFNVSVSVALCLQALRRRLELSEFNWKLNPVELLELRIKWCSKYLRNGELVRRELERRIQEE